MVKITFNITTAKVKDIKVRYRLREGRAIQLYHRTDIVADKTNLAKLKPDGTPRDRVQIYDADLSRRLRYEYDIISKAYDTMRAKGYEITSVVLEQEIDRIKNPISYARSESPNVVTEFRKYADDSLRHGIIGEPRYKHIKGVIDKLDRFLSINGISRLTVAEFTSNHLKDFRDFLFHEYEYVEQYPALYEAMNNRNKPIAPRAQNTVVSMMKMVQAFFSQLEENEEINRSPFKKLGKSGRNAMMRAKYDDPIYLHRDELLKIIATDVPQKLQDTKDAFIVQCALGCRIGDFQKMGMSNIAVSDEGIPYVHYIPHKTAKIQTNNKEIQTPIVRYAFDIIKRRNFIFPQLKNLWGSTGYNASIKYLLSVCNISREVLKYNNDTEQNEKIPLCDIASTKLCRKTHIDLMSKVQIDLYAAGLHKKGSTAVNRYTNLEIKDRFILMNVAYGQKPYTVNSKLEIK